MVCADQFSSTGAARKLRMQQCREAWHLDHEPEPPELADGQRFDDRVAAAAAAVELVQVGSIVHDFLGRAATRRDRPTINAVEGIDHAVLAGDFILARRRAGGLGERETAALVAETLGDLCEGQAFALLRVAPPARSPYGCAYVSQRLR